MIKLSNKSAIRGMDVDFVEGEIFISSFDGYLYHYRMSTPLTAVS